MENQQAQSNRVKNLDNYTLQTELHQGKKKNHSHRNVMYDRPKLYSYFTICSFFYLKC